MTYSNSPDIARVNRQTGLLWLNSKIWDRLPTDQKDYVLFHEKGHLQLQTSDEFKANLFAMKKFAPAGKFNNQQLGQKIIVMKEILSKADNPSFTWVADASAGAVGGIMQNLAVLGIGSKARQKEALTNAQAQAEILKAQSESKKGITKIVLILGVIALLGTVIYLTLKKK